MVKRGDVFFASFEPGIGSEQWGDRPVVIIQNDIGNLHSPTTIVAMITSKHKNNLPTHVRLQDNSIGLSDESVVLLEQIRTIDKTRLGNTIGHLPDGVMDRIDQAILCSFDLNQKQTGGNKNVLLR